MKTEVADGWADCPWLLAFLNSQQVFAAGRAVKLIDHDFWANVSEILNGLDQGFIRREFAKMDNWLRDNPQRMPTPRGVRKFVANWLERAYGQERKIKGDRK
jgi:hypothetical protein